MLGVHRIDPAGDAVGFVQLRGYDGRLLKEHVFDTSSGAETVEAMVRSGDHLYLAGRTSGAFPGFVNAGQTDLFVSRIPVRGEAAGPLPLLQAGDERPQHPQRLAIDSGGHLLMAGFEDLHVPYNYVESWEDSLTARVLVGADAQPFSLDWMRKGGTEHADLVLGLVAPGPEGEMLVSGQERGGPTVGAFVQRLNADGSTAWKTRLSHVGLDAVSALAWGPDGQLYVAGSSFLEIGEHSYGEQDVFVTVMDADDGSIVRSMQAGTAGSDWVRDLEVDAHGNVWVAGSTLGAFPGFTQHGTYDAFLVRFDVSGRWSAWQHGTAMDDEVHALALDHEGHVYLVGHAEGAFVEGENFGGERDGFLIRLSLDALKTP